MSELAPGLYPNIPMEEYHQLPGVSQSMLKTLRDLSPAHLKWQMDHPSPSTPAQILGSAVHDCVLLPELFETAWVRNVEGDGRTKAVKEARAALAAEHPEATVLSASDHDTCLAIRDAIAAHPKARQLLIGDAEQSALWIDEPTGVLARGRFDLLGHKTGTIVDLKTTRCAARDPFHRDIWNYGYHIQAAHYLGGAKALGLPFRNFAFVAIEKDPPYGVALYELSIEAIQDGTRELRPLLDRYAECLESDTWPGYSENVEVIDIPVWAPRQIDERLGEAA